MEHTYCGKTWEQMDEILTFLCNIEDHMDFQNKEQEMFDVAIQCVTTVMNRMKDDRPIEWD